MSSAHVLCIAAQNVLTFSHAAVLEDSGYQVTLANSEATAFDALTAQPMDLIIFSSLLETASLPMIQRIKVMYPTVPVLLLEVQEDQYFVIADSRLRCLKGAKAFLAEVRKILGVRPGAKVLPIRRVKS